MKGVFKCAKEDDERRSESVKGSSLGIPPCTPKKYSRRLKRLSLGVPPCIPFFINNYQFVLLHTIFLSLHMLCALLGASCFSFQFQFLVLFALFASHILWDNRILDWERDTLHFCLECSCFHFYLLSVQFQFLATSLLVSSCLSCLSLEELLVLFMKVLGLSCVSLLFV